MVAILNFVSFRRIFRDAPSSAVASSVTTLRTSQLHSQLAARWLRDADGQLTCVWQARPADPHLAR